jgi:hypothetical protein
MAQSKFSGILLHSRTPLEQIAPENVHFTFGNGRYTYDCVSCGSKCCRGFGYGTSVAELQDQLAKRPHLRFFVQGSDKGPTKQVRNCPPGCFFLSTDGLCGIQRDLGYDAKPETCRLFPFNDLRTVGQFLIVSPHPGLCPLGIASPGTRDSRSDHDQLLDAMRLRGIAASITKAACIHADIPSVMALERRIIDMSEDAIIGSRFLSLVSHQVDALNDSPALSSGRRTTTSPFAFIEHCCAVLGCENPVSRPDLTDIDTLFIAMTPYLRRRLVFRDIEPGRTPAFGITLDRIPQYLAGWYLMAILSRLAGMQSVAYGTVLKIEETSKPLLLLLSHIDRYVTWTASANIDVQAAKGDFSRPFIRIAKALLPSTQGREPRTLGDILVAHTPFEGVERVEFLRFLAQQLVTKIAEPPTDRAVHRHRLPLRHRVQRLGLQLLSENVLHSACNRS